MQVKYTSDDVVVEINGMKCVGFADYNDHEKQILVDEGFQRMARKIAVLEQQRAELLEALGGLLECPRGKLQWADAQAAVLKANK